MLPSIGNLSGHVNRVVHWTTDGKSHCPVALLNCNPSSHISCVGLPPMQRMNDRQLLSIWWVVIVSLGGHRKHSTFSGQSQARVNGLKLNSSEQRPGSGPPGPHLNQALQSRTFGMNAFNSSSSQIVAFCARTVVVTANVTKITATIFAVKSILVLKFKIYQRFSIHFTNHFKLKILVSVLAYPTWVVLSLKILFFWFTKNRSTIVINVWKYMHWSSWKYDNATGRTFDNESTNQ